LNLVSPLAGEPNDIAEAQGRRKHRGRLCRRGSRPRRGPHRQEKSESKTRETVQDVTACLMRFPPGQRRAPARTETATVTGRHRRAACAFRQRRWLAWRRPWTI
jgi:hypothetical protein